MPASQLPSPRLRITVYAVLLALFAAMAAFSLHQISLQARADRSAALAVNPKLLHVQQMQLAAARAVLDVLARNVSAPDVFPAADLQHQRRLMQASWLGLEQLEAQDAPRQGLMLETRASLAQFDAALDAALVAPQDKEANDSSVHLLLALARMDRALTNDSGSLQQQAVQALLPPSFGISVGVWFGMAGMLLVAIIGLNRK